VPRHLSFWFFRWSTPSQCDRVGEGERGKTKHSGCGGGGPPVCISAIRVLHARPRRAARCAAFLPTPILPPCPPHLSLAHTCLVDEDDEIFWFSPSHSSPPPPPLTTHPPPLIHTHTHTHRRALPPAPGINEGRREYQGGGGGGGGGGGMPQRPVGLVTTFTTFILYSHKPPVDDSQASTVHVSWRLKS
jgi:hypothetical protein